MFNTIVHRTENHDLEIASRKGYENKINQLESDLRKSCTPDQLILANHITEEFRKSLVFKYISADNSLINAVVWKSCSCVDTLEISFTLNGKNITVSVPDLRMVIRAGGNKRHILDEIKNKISSAIANELTQYVLMDVVDFALGE
jgi:hypothetical protein